MDTISNTLSRIKNAAASGRKVVEVPYTRVAEQIGIILKEAGYMEEVRVFKPENSSFKKIHYALTFEDGQPKITSVKRVSKPGRRIYRGSRELRPVMGGYGISIVSTPRGLMKNSEARKRKLGGEVVCEVY